MDKTVGIAGCVGGVQRGQRVKNRLKKYRCVTVASALTTEKRYSHFTAAERVTSNFVQTDPELDWATSPPAKLKQFSRFLA